MIALSTTSRSYRAATQIPTKADRCRGRGRAVWTRRGDRAGQNCGVVRRPRGAALASLISLHRPICKRRVFVPLSLDDLRQAGCRAEIKWSRSSTVRQVVTRSLSDPPPCRAPEIGAAVQLYKEVSTAQRFHASSPRVDLRVYDRVSFTMRCGWRRQCSPYGKCIQRSNNNNIELGRFGGWKRANRDAISYPRVGGIYTEGDFSQSWSNLVGNRVAVMTA